MYFCTCKKLTFLNLERGRSQLVTFLVGAFRRRTGSSPAHKQKFFVQVSFGFVRLFSQIFLMSPKCPPRFFFYFAKEWMFKNSQRAPFYIFWHYATYRQPKKIGKKISKKNSDFFQFFPHAGTVEENT